jgi:hypothetical protein
VSFECQGFPAEAGTQNRLIKGVVCSGGDGAEPYEAFAEEKEEGDYSGAFRPFSRGASSFCGFVLHLTLK